MLKTETLSDSLVSFLLHLSLKSRVVKSASFAILELQIHLPLPKDSTRHSSQSSNYYFDSLHVTQVTKYNTMINSALDTKNTCNY
jgi:hypothetical protein